MAKEVFEYPQREEEFEQYLLDNPVHHVWHDGPVMRVYTGNDIPQVEQ